MFENRKSQQIFWHCLFASCNFYLFSTYVLHGSLHVFHLVITVSLLHHWKTEPWQGHDNFERGKGNHFTFWKNIKQSLSPPCSPQDAIFDLDQPKVTVVPPPVCHKNVCQLLHWRANARLSLPLLKGPGQQMFHWTALNSPSGQTKTLPKCKLLILYQHWSRQNGHLFSPLVPY